MYLTHSHPDHLFGATKFADVEFVTSQGVMDEINILGDIYKARKEAIKDTIEIRMPIVNVTVGTTKWDGLTVEIGEVKNCEAASALTLKKK